MNANTPTVAVVLIKTPVRAHTTYADITRTHVNTSVKSDGLLLGDVYDRGVATVQACRGQRRRLHYAHS
jgi:hypothetical protein